MAKQRLGDKKVAVIERILGVPVAVAYTRGGWRHFFDEVFTKDGRRLRVNYKTGEVEECCR